MDQARSVTGFVSGRVQGVGFRYFVMRHAQAENLGGYVRNLDVVASSSCCTAKPLRLRK